MVGYFLASKLDTVRQKNMIKLIVTGGSLPGVGM